jgi:aspartyl-tRNA(Asn)/glutamyl-tRNA(Gln) amidotransferase subunit A
MEWATAAEIADAVAGGQRSALSITDGALARIAKRNPSLNAFTTVVSDRARAKAREIDRQRGEGRQLGPLAGVPFAVKNLFDVKGLPTSPAPRSIATMRLPRDAIDRARPRSSRRGVGRR